MSRGCKEGWYWTGLEVERGRVQEGARTGTQRDSALAAVCAFRACSPDTDSWCGVFQMLLHMVVP